ncbi:nitrogenase stabilizing/protective protein [Hydrococcus rivularis NIES-593]|uniref:Nitrogenase-stabilizing/protective protein NifW n=1 Tax=Hydrococcus rivularis NIES-593 TaxID=1921803 RepID=A0A1U7HLJ2_9CYAN|nr:nitrogenase-stabilizing/protective protein NifW [Hydrococcus rivularis]OKH24456.1 nitrogenase stabilizing/protective protein [Hydrococcus rivularis NIES-593]
MTLTTATKRTLAEFRKLTDAEDYLQFFNLPYRQDFVNVNRLHILKQFALLIAKIDEVFPNVSEEERLEKYRLALTEAYELFQTASPLETKLFKVFNETPKNFVSLESLAKKAGVI